MRCALWAWAAAAAAAWPAASAGRPKPSTLRTCAECAAEGYRWSEKKNACGQFANGIIDCAAASDDTAEPPTEAAETTAAQQQLLEDFIAAGFVELSVPNSELPRGAHRRIYERTLQLWEGAGRVLGAGLGNNILPAVPELHALLETPTVRDGLSSILGPRYVLHAHRFLHHSNENDQDWHKDSFWGRRRMRSHLPRWCMLLYYPQRTTNEMGPTALLNGTQYVTTDHEAESLPAAARGSPFGEDRLDWTGHLNGTYRSPDLALRDRALASAPDRRLGFSQAAEDADGLGQEVMLTGKAARVVIMSYDLFHRASRTGRSRLASGNGVRFLFKLQFARTQSPSLQVRKRHFLRHLYIKCIILPRQAWDKHRENSKKVPFSLSNRRCRQVSILPPGPPATSKQARRLRVQQRH